MNDVQLIKVLKGGFTLKKDSNSSFLEKDGIRIESRTLWFTQFSCQNNFVAVSNNEDTKMILVQANGPEVWDVHEKQFAPAGEGPFALFIDEIAKFLL